MNKKKFFYLIFIIFLCCLVFFPFYFLNKNIDKQNISTGFHFLSQEAGFEISESLINYNSFMNYGRALWAGVINTAYIAIIGNILALVLGIFLGIFSLSKNYLLSKFCFIYLNFFRNIPLLLHLFFWYGIFTDIMPSVKKAKIIMGVFISNRGISIPWFETNLVLPFLILTLIISFCLTFMIFKASKRFSNKIKKFILPIFFILIEIAQIELLFQYFPIQYPAVQGFNVYGGISFSPEFISLLFGLVLYTAAFIGEIIRAGIIAVEKGQWEAAYSLGMNKIQTLKKIILPQSFKVALPPLTAQFLNLTKNSSLAVAIGYPDFVSIANTSMNQTGQAVELVLLIMALYLLMSLFVSGFANTINRRILGVSEK